MARGLFGNTSALSLRKQYGSRLYVPVPVFVHISLHATCSFSSPRCSTPFLHTRRTLGVGGEQRCLPCALYSTPSLSPRILEAIEERYISRILGPKFKAYKDAFAVTFVGVDTRYRVTNSPLATKHAIMVRCA